MIRTKIFKKKSSRITNKYLFLKSELNFINNVLYETDYLSINIYDINQLYIKKISNNQYLIYTDSYILSYFLKLNQCEIKQVNKLHLFLTIKNLLFYYFKDNKELKNYLKYYINERKLYNLIFEGK